MVVENASFTMFLGIKGKSELPLQPGELYLLGKQINGGETKSTNFIQLDEEEDLDQRHCVIEIYHNEDAYVFDLFSSKGTLLNNKPLNSLQKTRLRNGDILNLGKNEIKYYHNQHEASRDSSGFLEVYKNTSDIIASSPDSTSELENRKKRLNNNFLVPSVPPRKSITPIKRSDVPESEPNTSKNSLNLSTASNNRRSDSFTIPETQYCRPHSSLNASDLSVAESTHDDNACKIKFNFGNLDSFDDDELCIPETQEIMLAGGISNNQRTRLLSEGLNEIKRKSCLELSSKLNDSFENSQFRISTQDYNEGFGEEESVAGLHSQIIPFISHKRFILNNTSKCSNDNEKNQTNEERKEKHSISLKWPDSKDDQETTEIRDCSTPDIFEAVNEMNQGGAKTNDNIDKMFTEQVTNVLDEDEEDLLPTQVVPPPVNKRHFSLNDLEKPCLEKENEEVLTLSDKENRCPVILDPMTDLPPTQIIEASSHTSISSNNNSSNNPNTNAKVANRNISKTLLNMQPDGEDDFLAEALLLPTIHPSTTTSISSKNLSIKCFNSTLLDDKTMSRNSATLFDEIERTTTKQNSPATNFKKPEKKFNVLKKTSTATTETDLELLMCTPQLIKDNIFVGKTEDLKQNILAAKNKDLFGDETDEEDDDDQGDLVKLINIPKESLDFDQLLPHLNSRPKCSKMSADEKAAVEAQKIYKFGISFGKEDDGKQSKNILTRSSKNSRDERHATRDKEKEIRERRGRRKTNDNRSRSSDKNKEVSGRKEIPDLDTKGRTKSKESSNISKAKSQEITKHAAPVTISEKSEENTSNKQYKTARAHKRHNPTEKREKSISEDKSQEMPPRRITRSNSRLDEAPSTSKEALDSISRIANGKEDDLVNVATNPSSKVTRHRSSRKQNDAQNNIASNGSSNQSKNDMTPEKSNERKRKAEAAAAVPAKVGRKSLRSTQSQDSLTPSSTDTITISMTMVDQEMFKDLVENANGLWNIAKNPADCDVLVMDKAYRTFKFLLAMSRGIPIVTSKYLKKINETQSKKGVRISDYLFSDAEFEKKFKFSLRKSLQSAKKSKIFAGYEFMMTASILPQPGEIKAIIETSGGYVHDKNPSQPKENRKLYLVTTEEDKKEWHKYRRLNKNIIIVSTEGIMSAVMTQNCGRLASYTLA